MSKLLAHLNFLPPMPYQNADLFATSSTTLHTRRDRLDCSEPALLARQPAQIAQRSPTADCSSH